MKKIFFILTMAFIVLNSCSTFELDQNSDIPQYVETHLKFSSDLTVEQEYYPLTRASTNNLYGINIYYDKERNGVIDDVYGYGLFDDIENITVSLLSNYTYRFECSMVVDGKTKIKSENGIYKQPFNVSVTNTFSLGSDSKIAGLDRGDALLIGSSYVETNPAIERYYGVFDDYKPVSEGNVMIELKKVNFGADLTIKGIQEGGRLAVKCEADGTFINLITIADAYISEKFYSFNDLQHAIDSPEGIQGKITYEYTSPYVSGLTYSGTANIVLKRFETTHITINANHPSANLNFEDNDMQDNIINIGLNGSRIIDIIITTDNN